MKAKATVERSLTLSLSIGSSNILNSGFGSDRAAIPIAAPYLSHSWTLARIEAAHNGQKGGAARGTMFGFFDISRNEVRPRTQALLSHDTEVRNHG